MLARRYETRLDEDGLITFEKVWSKRINIHVEKNEFKHPEHIYELCKALWLRSMCFCSCLIQKCTSNLSLRLVLEMFPQALSTSVE